MILRTKVGQHEISYDPDTSVMHEVIRGAVTVQELRELAQFVRQCTQGGDLFWLIDIREAKAPTIEARKASAELVGEGDANNHFAIFGGNFAIRAIVNLVFKAMSLASPKVSMHYAVDEADGRAWLAERRRDALARKA
ncbi:MAG TPA: STAS/SEC14 domain-containing protein [Labilithrix sp.]|jgi:hypothetical protein|nr:STAS/SEC14 domain-containing protein [Labilithrix sp.]